MYFGNEWVRVPWTFEGISYRTLCAIEWHVFSASSSCHVMIHTPQTHTHTYIFQCGSYFTWMGDTFPDLTALHIHFICMDFEWMGHGQMRLMLCHSGEKCGVNVRDMVVKCLMACCPQRFIVRLKSSDSGWLSSEWFFLLHDATHRYTQWQFLYISEYKAGK